MATWNWEYILAAAALYNNLEVETSSESYRARQWYAEYVKAGIITNTQ